MQAISIDTSILGPKIELNVLQKIAEKSKHTEQKAKNLLKFNINQ